MIILVMMKQSFLHTNSPPIPHYEKYHHHPESFKSFYNARWYDVNDMCDNNDDTPHLNS